MAKHKEPASGSETIRVPELCLVALIGASGSGKSTFAVRHFRPTEILSSDHYRGVVGDDENDQSVTKPAFEALHFVAGLRLSLGRLVVVDATNVKPQDRAALVHLTREHDVQAIAVVLDLDERVCLERNASRANRAFGAHVVHNHIQSLRRGLRGLEREGFRRVYILHSEEEASAAVVVREPLWTDRRAEKGPFDIIGDIHGCYEELVELLGLLGYIPDEEAGFRSPYGRRAIFLGDVVDRGPKIIETTRLVMQMVGAGAALCLPGNHDVKLERYLSGRKVQVNHGLAESIEQISSLTDADRTDWTRQYRNFTNDLVSHLVLDGGNLVVAHAGMIERYQGRASGRVRAFALYGETTGEIDEFGLPVRINWAVDYRGRAAVIYGHTPIPEAYWLNNTINIDTGCVFGGRLTALRWPERELISVSAQQAYAAGIAAGDAPRPTSTAASQSKDQPPDTLLRIEDVQGKQVVSTRLMHSIIIEEDRVAAALEVMSRFALDPRWLIYLPPTMSPCETSAQADWLEYPTEALSYYRKQEIPVVVCEEKHMGSRAIVVLCRDGIAASRRFGVAADDLPGACYTRTGRRFFDDDRLYRELIGRLRGALDTAGFWEQLQTDWVCLDAELLPWSAKAMGLTREQYAPVGAAGEAALTPALASVEAAERRGLPLGDLATRLRGRREELARYVEAYRRYCWEVSGLEGVRIAPFHLLATEGRTYFDRDHLWHMATLARLADADPLFLATAHREVQVQDPEECRLAAQWWEELTGQGGEGMVIKPRDFISSGKRGLVQPAVKCRGRDYLRIIYGPTYTEPANLERLRKRGLTFKRSLALREFALGVEALERFVRREPLWKVHQAVFAVLAMESEPVDPRL